MSTSDYLNHSMRETTTFRKALGVMVGLVLVAVLPVTAFANENCSGYDHKSDPPVSVTAEWGSSVVGADNVTFNVSAGYTLSVCVKGGANGITELTIIGPDSQQVFTPNNPNGHPAGLSHYEWTFTTTTTTTSSTTTTDPGSSSTTSSTIVDSSTTTTPSTSTTDPGQTTTTTSEDTTTTSTLPATTTTLPDSTTSVPAEPTTTADSSETGETLPFTGPERNVGLLATLAIILISSGVLALGWMRGRLDND